MTTNDDKDPEPQRRSRVLPFLCVLVALLLANPIILLSAGQRSLAACLGVVVILGCLIAFRIIARRGRISLAILVVGVPLLAAMGLSAHRYASPMLQRQRSFDLLDAAGVGYQSRAPRRSGQWISNHSGTLIPRWVETVLGKDCLSELRRIDGQLVDFQSLPFRQLDTSDLYGLHLRRFDGQPPFSDDLVEWVNENPRIYLSIILDRYSDEDGEQLSRVNRFVHAAIQVDEQSGDFSRMQVPIQLTLSGKQISRRQLVQACQLKELTMLCLEVWALPDDGLEGIELPPDLRTLDFTGTSFNLAGLESVGRQKVERLVLHSVGLPNQIDFPNSDECHVEHLHLSGSTPSIQQLRGLTRLTGCQSITFEGPRTDDEVSTLWDSPNLVNVYRWGQGYKRFDRPKD